MVSFIKRLFALWQGSTVLCFCFRVKVAKAITGHSHVVETIGPEMKRYIIIFCTVND